MTGGFAGVGLAFLVWIVVLGLIIWAVVVAVRHSTESSSSGDSALYVLKGKYASGEVNKEEYIDKKKILSQAEELCCMYVNE